MLCGPHNNTDCSILLNPRSSIDFNVDYQTEGFQVVAAREGYAYPDPGCNQRVVINHGDGWETSYLHLKNITIPPGNFWVDRWDLLGETGNFNQPCGNTNGVPHVHFSLIKDGSFYNLNNVDIGGYTVDTVSRCLNHPQYSQVCSGGTVINDGTVGSYPPPSCSKPSSDMNCELLPPILISPNEGQIMTSKTVSFNWQSPNSTNQNGYTFRLNTNSDPNVQPWIVDTGLGNNVTTYNHPFSNEGSYFWHMRTWDTSNNSSDWVTRQFHINTTGTLPPPGQWSAVYFNDTNLSSQCAGPITVPGPYVFYDWAEDPPITGCNNENWSARFTGTVHFENGYYTFGLGSDDWGRIYVNQDLVVNNWMGIGQHYESRNLSDGDYLVTIEFADTLGAARLAAWWWGPGFIVPQESQDQYQWFGQYWGNKDLWWDSIVRKNGGFGNLNVNWGSGSPGYGLPSDRFSSRFERNVYFSCGTYEFSITNDDGVRFWIDNNLIRNEWRPHVGSYTDTVQLGEGYHWLKVEHFEEGGDAFLTLDWSFKRL